jgi:hypothetical protein
MMEWGSHYGVTSSYSVIKSAKNERIIKRGKSDLILDLPHIAREVKGIFNKIPFSRASWFPEGRYRAGSWSLYMDKGLYLP